MLFNSSRFLIYFPVVTVLFFLTPHRWRWLLMLGASCYFYMAFIPKYILILAFTIVVDYFAGILIEDAAQPRRKYYLWMSLFANIGVLFVFKYFNFFNENLAALARVVHWNYPLGALNIILPLGLSFHTFQAMSYTFEVYYGRSKAERHFGVYALYVMFYPQLVAGPIERPYHLLPQFHSEQRVDWERIGLGLQLMLWGFFQKVVIADRLSVLVDRVYNHPGAQTGLPVLLATYAFAFQIYCDFSGYSDIAIGAAQVMGFKLMTNFNRPYFSESVSEFWRRWHISLSTWFRDYLFKPIALRYRKRGDWGITYALAVTFLTSGLWHGANWTYVAWGAVHGTCVILSLWSQGIRDKAAAALRLDRFPAAVRAFNMFVTFHAVCFAWIFFRAGSIRDAFVIIRSLAGAASWHWNAFLGMTRWDVRVGAGALLVLLAVHVLQRTGSLRERLSLQPAWVRWPLYYASVALIVFFGKFTQRTFIYFQF